MMFVNEDTDNESSKLNLHMINLMVVDVQT